MTPKEVEELTVLWTSAQRTVAAFIRTLLTDWHEAEEVLQRVAVTLVRKHAEYDASRPFVPWALGFAKLEALAYLRRRGAERLVFDNGLVEQIAETYAQAAQEPLPYNQFLGECVEELDGRSRRAIELRYGGDLKTAQIAHQMQLSDGAVRTLLSRARTLMRQCLEVRIALERCAMSDEVKILIHAHLDGELTEEQRRRLAGWLGESSANVERFVEECRLHSELFDLHCRAGEDLLSAATPAESRPAGRGASFRDGAAAGAPAFVFHQFPSSLGVPLTYAAVALLLGIGLLAAGTWPMSDRARQSAVDEMSTGPMSELSCVARLSGMESCRWVDLKAAARDGERVTLGRTLAISSGLLGVTYSTGVRVTLVGPATYIVDSPKGGFLSLGTISVSVQPAEQRAARSNENGADRESQPRAAAYFCVCTPAARLTNRGGGEFRVCVDKSGGSSVYVVEGSVSTQGVGHRGGLFWKHGGEPATVVYGAGQEGHYPPFSGIDAHRGELPQPGS